MSYANYYPSDIKTISGTHWFFILIPAALVWRPGPSFSKYRVCLESLFSYCRAESITEYLEASGFIWLPPEWITRHWIFILNCRVLGREKGCEGYEELGLTLNLMLLFRQVVIRRAGSYHDVLDFVGGRTGSHHVGAISKVSSHL